MSIYPDHFISTFYGSTSKMAEVSLVTPELEKVNVFFGDQVKYLVVDLLLPFTEHNKCIDTILSFSFFFPFFFPLVLLISVLVDYFLLLLPFVFILTTFFVMYRMDVGIRSLWISLDVSVTELLQTSPYPLQIFS